MSQEGSGRKKKSARSTSPRQSRGHLRVVAHLPAEDVDVAIFGLDVQHQKALAAGVRLEETARATRPNGETSPCRTREAVVDGEHHTDFDPASQDDPYLLIVGVDPSTSAFWRILADPGGSWRIPSPRNW